MVLALVVRLPMYVWLWERPGRPANTIASSLFVWLELQMNTKYGPPGKPGLIATEADRPAGARNAAPASASTIPPVTTTAARRLRLG